MKLLSRQEISIAKQRDTSREVQEGLKLTRRVDSLRELRLSEEKKLEDWRRETLESIQGEISILSEKKDTLERQITSLEQKIAELSPQMATERHSLIELKKELAKWQKELEVKASNLLSEELNIAEVIEQSKKTELESAHHEVKALKLEESAEKKHFNAQKTLEQAQKIHQEALKERKDIELALSLRENNVTLRERRVQTMELAIMKAQKENENEQKRLVDVSTMLQRDLLRLKKLRTDVSR